MGESIYEIETARCTECVGHFEQPQCQQVCPVDCIPLDPDNSETAQQLQGKYNAIIASA